MITMEELLELFEEQLKKMQIFHDIFSILISECVKSSIEFHINNGKTYMNQNNIFLIILQVLTEVQGIKHLNSNSTETAKKIRDKYINKKNE